MSPSPRILLVEYSRELGHLYRFTLADEGFQVSLALAPDDLLASVRAYRPDLLILDLPPPEERALAVLDALRSDDVARMVPVIALTTQDQLADVAWASYNVVRTFAKPFDLDDFVEAAREHSAEPGMLATVRAPRPHGGDARDLAEHILAARSRHIVFRWVQRVRTRPPWRDRPDLTLESLIDYAPRVLELVDVRLHYDSDEEFFALHPHALDRAEQHARLRMQQEISVTAAVYEYTLLREEVWVELREHFPAEVDADGLFEVERAINRTVDAILVATMRSYLEQVAR
ncbi:MAG: response regulator [Dehalococcoidia bacterium]|nr:response regulator [Dehalococcoidia bacterium]